MRILNTVSLKLVVTSLFVLILTIMFGSAIFLQLRSENLIFNTLGEKITSAQIETVHNNLFNYLKVPIQANAAVEMTMRELLVDDMKDLQEFESPLRRTMRRVFPYSPQLSLVAFGSITGDYVGISRGAQKDTFSLILKDSRTHGVLNFYSDLSVDSPVRTVVNAYDPRTRPWYRETNKSQTASWTPAYQDMDALKGTSISYSSPVYDINKRYVGVVSSDIKLDEFNHYLRNIPNLGNGVIFIINGNNEIISHSTIEKSTPSTLSGLANQGNAHLLLPASSDSPIVRSIAPYLANPKISKVTFEVHGDTFYGRMVFVGEELGLTNWRMVVIVPQDDLVGIFSSDRMVTVFLILSIFIIGVTLAWFTLSRITTPILELAKQARLIAKLKWTPPKESRFELKEIKLLNDAFNEMSTTLSKAFLSLKRQVYYDSVTGLLSKEGLTERMRELAAQEEQSLWNGLILISLDNVNKINNSLGYKQGETLLREFVKRLQGVAPDDTLLARINDTEFAICYPHSGGDKICTQEINKYLHIFSSVKSDDGSELLFSGNVGFSKDRFDDKELPDNLRNASVALMAARKKGSGAYEVYHPDMMAKAIENTQMLTNLNQALVNDEFLVYFQPIVSLENNRVIGAEALIRWNSKVYGMVAPSIFIPLAEESGLILSIGRWMLRESCRQLSEKISSGWPENFEIHVNVSVSQLMQSDLYSHIITVLDEFNLSPKNLTLEITESLIMESNAVIKEQLTRIRALGVSIAIDDFGSGFSSLSYLHNLNFDCLKIDRDFVCSVLENSKSEAIISAVIRLANGLSVPLIAEGIETKAVAEKLYELGCLKAQGYYFSRPIPLDDWDTPGYIVND
ncbi:bifunctional diguanylate cyclase/phosphodiesterase [Budvicia diplopodorum]|uniref:bifunctional diguanylate cyclase/phosphodiesterase n=1 Tax=Budvicia diplopodorum TaxID=1119056 RepID=UPI00135C338C|nr:EAL domain-containing protein [Budvicia diplopodorum]